MKHILVIEDERTYANILGELIRDDGFKCTVVYSAAEAEQLLPNLKSEVQGVILDLMMTRTGSFAQGPFPAGETGDEVYKRIRDVAPHLPIVIMTAKTRESLNSQYPLDQNTHIFLKPIDSAMVAKLVKLLKNI